MNNESLFSRIKNLVATERRIGVKILECLYEIERRKAYAELKYDGLFTYCIKELGFTDSQAHQRIQAMRALKDLPELKTKIESGSLSVSSISKVQAHLKKERQAGKRIGVSQKLELFQLMENRTSKEVEIKLSEIRGEALKIKLIFELDEEAEVLWKQVQDLALHRTGGDVLSTFKMLAKQWLKQNDPARETQERTRTTHFSRNTRSQVRSQVRSSTETQIQRAVPLLTQVERPTRSISTRLKREIWRRDQGKCKNCQSTHGLEIDHITPYALGGEHSIENLRLLCRSCNQFSAIQVYGQRKMEKYMNPDERTYSRKGAPGK